jgi:uncharacterized protein YjbI with pentapeptide repeats
MRQVHAADGVSTPVLHDGLTPATIQPLRAGRNTVAEAKKIDPFDVEALEKSLNDSATRVSTIWVSFLIFSLYLLTAATTVTHRQLFLAEPVKLPVLNIDLPLWGFFWLAPILFVIFHAYVLIQLILLARTAAAYDTAVAKLVEQDNLSSEANTSLRQRLANTLFAQILAGSPREREGWFGSLLKAMAWITLVIAPILILLTFQFMFLPYHSHLATWTHRLLILLELVVAFQLWPLVLNPQRDFQWPDWRWRLGEVTVRAKDLFGSSDGRQRSRQGPRRLALPMAATALFVLLSLSLATFPGEPHVNLFTGRALDVVQCGRWIHQQFEFTDMRFDRLALARVDVVDDEKLEKIQQATSKAGERAYQGERTRILRDRNLNCGDFSDYADLRRIDLAGAHLREANFRFSKLEGVSFTKARLQHASFDGSQVRGAFFNHAQLQGASFNSSQLQGASFGNAELQGASFAFARLQGSSFEYGHLQGVIFSFAKLQGASLDGAQIQGGFFHDAKLNGSSLGSARLQGASLDSAELQGAYLDSVRLQGASLNKTSLDDAVLFGAWVWNARYANCENARVTDPKIDAVIDPRGFGGEESTIGKSDQIEKFITTWVAKIPEGSIKENARTNLRERLTATKDDAAALGEAWRRCESDSHKISQEEFDGRHLAVLRATVCDGGTDGAAIGKGIAHNWISYDKLEFSGKLARALLGEDGKPCVPAKDYDESTRMQLRQAAGPPPATIAPK